MGMLELLGKGPGGEVDSWPRRGPGRVERSKREDTTVLVPALRRGVFRTTPVQLAIKDLA